MDSYDAIIVGAGAAGLMTAISAGLRGKRCLIVEANSRPGLKILISGGGRCNFTNLDVQPHHYVSQNPHFCKSALRQFTSQDFVQWVQSAEIEYYEKTLGQLFCKTSSKLILKLLLDKLESLPVTILTGTKIRKIENQNSIFQIQTEESSYETPRLVIATGGLSYPKLGASSWGYDVAQQFGHEIISPEPALDGLLWLSPEKKHFGALAGLSTPATVSLKKTKFTEPVLFTHDGLSGPAILKISLYWKEGQSLQIDWLPQVDDLQTELSQKRDHHPQKKLSSILSEWLPARFASTLLHYLLIDDKKMIETSNKSLQKVVAFLKTFPFTPDATVGFHKAEVTRGGVSTKAISSKTMESKKQPGLYFVGEVLDVTGLLGGYNFQWAWSSGWVAGRNL